MVDMRLQSFMLQAVVMGHIKQIGSGQVIEGFEQIRRAVDGAAEGDINTEPRW